MHRHAGRVVSRDNDCAEFANGAHPGDAEGRRQPETRERQRDAQKNFRWRKPEQRGLLLQNGRHRVKCSHGAQYVITHANVNLRQDEGGSAVGHAQTEMLQRCSNSSVRAEGQREQDTEREWWQQNGHQQHSLPP